MTRTKNPSLRESSWRGASLRGKVSRAKAHGVLMVPKSSWEASPLVRGPGALQPELGWEDHLQGASQRHLGNSWNEGLGFLRNGTLRDELGVRDLQVLTTVCTIGRRQGPAVRHRELCSIPCNSL